MPKTNKMRYFFSILVIFIVSQTFSQTTKNRDFWLTEYEKSNFKKTHSYHQTISYCEKLADYSDNIHLSYFGNSARKNKLPLLIIDKDGDTLPETIRKKQKLIVLIQANIHPGEPDGLDAMFTMLRDMIVDDNKAILKHLSILFIPSFNADGHLRFGPYNRINQNGPDEMGWRTTAQNLNLNRDFMKADSPEMKAWLRLYHRWEPDFFIDTHTTNGADYQYVITYSLETDHGIDPEIGKWLKNQFVPDMNKEMFRQGHKIFPYVSFRQWHDPRSGLYIGVAPPMLSNGYVSANNRPGLLIETHMLKPYKARVESTRALIEFSLKKLATEKNDFRRRIEIADKNTSSPLFRKEATALKYRRSEKDSIMVDFLGVDYRIDKSKLTSGNWFIYDSTKPVTIKLPLYAKNEVQTSVLLPDFYIIPPEWDDVIERLILHGVQISYIEQDTAITCLMTEFTKVNFRSQPNEGRQIPEFQTVEKIKKHEFPKGSVIVNMNQKKARVIAHLLEPDAWDSFVYWGFFNTIFEQKEYAESYVMEPLAFEMLKQNPEIGKELEKFLEENPGMKTNQWGILNWFYMKTPWADSRYKFYPVGRVFEKLPDIFIKNQ